MAARELERIAGHAVEAALDAGAGDAEAFVQDSTGLEVRIFDQGVESLTEAGERGLGVRGWTPGWVPPPPRSRGGTGSRPMPPPTPPPAAGTPRTRSSWRSRSSGR